MQGVFLKYKVVATRITVAIPKPSIGIRTMPNSASEEKNISLLRTRNSIGANCIGSKAVHSATSLTADRTDSDARGRKHTARQIEWY